MKVITDAIHADLLESLHILCEDRFGWEVFVPVGMEWYERGVWNFERERLGDAVAKQFLQHQSEDIAIPTSTVPGLFTGHVKRPGTTHPRATKMVTWEQAHDLKPDIVISTLVENDLGWAQFARDVGATFGVQVGNQGANANWMAAQFAMLSVTTPGFVPWKPHVYYHQEFSLESFAPDPDGLQVVPGTVRSFVQCISCSAGYDRFQALARPEDPWTVGWYGHCEPFDDLWLGNNPTTRAVADRMHEAQVGWHWKEWSDGYGHVIHNWAAIGRPLLVTADYYRDKLAGPLLVEGQGSFDIRRRTDQEIRDLVERLTSDYTFWQEQAHAMAARFQAVVNFDEEAAEIRAMIEGVLP